MYRDSALETIIKGAMAGLVGTLAINLAMSRGPALMQRLGLMEAPPPAPMPQSGAMEEAHAPTEKLADKLSSGVLQQPLEPGTRKAAGQAIQWGYGALWGALYGVLESSIQLPSFIHGAIFGSAVGVVGATALPAMGLAPAPKDQPMPMTAMQTVDHLIYGWVTALVFRLLSRDV
jgi:putative membrane protein